jgi:hypothetical protein
VEAIQRRVSYSVHDPYSRVVTGVSDLGAEVDGLQVRYDLNERVIVLELSEELDNFKVRTC